MVTLTVVTFETDGSFEEQELSYDLGTLEATVTASALKSLSVGGGPGSTTIHYYWNISASE